MDASASVLKTADFRHIFDTPVIFNMRSCVNLRTLYIFNCNCGFLISGNNLRSCVINSSPHLQGNIYEVLNAADCLEELVIAEFPDGPELVKSLPNKQSLREISLGATYLGELKIDYP